MLTRHTLLKVVNKLIAFSVIFFFSLLNIATIYKAYVHFVLSVRKLNNLQISAYCRYTTWRNLTTSTKDRLKALGTANRIGWENNKQQKQWTLKRESLVPGRTNETGGWNLAGFPAAVQETSPRSSLSLLTGGTRDSGADRAHVTATKKETKLKIKYLEGLENFLYTQLVTQWSASALWSAWFHSSSGFFHISINFRTSGIPLSISMSACNFYPVSVLLLLASF